MINKLFGKSPPLTLDPDTYSFMTKTTENYQDIQGYYNTKKQETGHNIYNGGNHANTYSADQFEPTSITSQQQKHWMSDSASKYGEVTQGENDFMIVNNVRTDPSARPQTDRVYIPNFEIYDYLVEN